MTLIFFLTSIAASDAHLPYRSADTAPTLLLLKALLLTALLLAVVYGLLLFVKRRGWLPGNTVQAQTGNGVQVISSRRVSPHTTAFVIRHGDQQLLLVESARQIDLQKLASTKDEKDDSDGD